MVKETVQGGIIYTETSITTPQSEALQKHGGYKVGNHGSSQKLICPQVHILGMQLRPSRRRWLLLSTINAL